MDMQTILMAVQVILALVIILSVIQQDTKSAVPSQFGGEGSQAYFKPKGKEAFLARLTKISGALFFLNALALLVLNK